MSKYLVIVESPNKTKKIKSYLGSEYDVTFTAGHIKDLPSKGINVDIKKDFAPHYEVMDGKDDIVKNIQFKASKAEMVYLGTDLDREGEYIAYGVISILPKGTQYKRIRFGSITKNEIINSITNASELDEKLVNSAETRRILDRICGYKVSFPTKQATGGPSAGRVQSAALRIIADREKEIIAFVPKEYWPIEVLLEDSKGNKITATIKVPNKLDIGTGKEANEICETLRTKNVLVSKYETKQVSTKAFPPFTTSTLYQSASSIMGWGSGKTAMLAQKLYESGRITYLRTDSTFMVPEFINSVRTEIPTKYGSSYLPVSANFFSNKPNAQEAHEAIRITDISDMPSICDEEDKLYNIIWKRTIASQISNMEQEKNSAEFECQKYVLAAYGSKIVFDGFRKVWDYSNIEDVFLPELKIGEKMKVIDVKTEQKFTQPPSRYSESSLIKELEKLGIGRPSTYATIIETLLNRKYVEKANKAIQATEMGIRVSDFLVKSNFCFIDLGFTADLEEKLDCIARGECEKIVVLQEFWDRLKSDLENATSIRDENSKTDISCPKCKKGYLVKKYSRFGGFYSCSNRTNKEIGCDYKADVGENGEVIEKVKKEEEISSFKCKKCGAFLIKKISKKGWEYLSCKNWNKSKECEGFFDKTTGEKIEFKKKAYKKWTKKAK